MKEIKCSRCNCKREVPDDYVSSECPKCRERSRAKAAEERAKAAEERETQKFQNLPVMTKEEFFRMWERYAKREFTEEDKEWLEKKWQEYLKNAFGDYVARYRIDKFPFCYADCWQIREMILHYWGLVNDAKYKWTDATDRLVVGSHCSKCSVCQKFYLYCERGEYSTKGDDYDRFYENLREAQRQVNSEDDFERKLRKAMGLD